MDNRLDTGTTDISVVIVNYNATDWTLKCIASVLDAPDAASREIIVVDNNSADDVGAAVGTQYPQVRLVLNEQNVGYSRAGNQGRRLARGRFVMTIDNDAIVMPGALDTLSSYLSANPDVSMVSPRLQNPDGTDQGTGRTFPTAVHGVFGRKTILTRLFPRNRVSRDYLISANNSGDEPFDVDWVSTACVLARADVVHSIEMDEGYFVYWVDADWCRVMKNEGWRIVCVPTAHAVHDEHRGRGHTGRRSVRSIVDFHKGAYRYYRKHHIRSNLDPRNFLAIAGLSVRTTVLLAQNARRKA